MDEAFADDWYGYMVDMLNTRRGKALAALVEAALRWREADVWANRMSLKAAVDL